MSTINETHAPISNGINTVMNKEVTLSYWAHTSMKSPNVNEHVGSDIRIHQVCVAHSQVPFGIPNTQARQAKLNKAFHKEIKRGLSNPDSSDFTAGLFHLRNQGIVIIAESFEPISGQKKEGLLKFGLTGTIIDGGHTCKIITENNQDYIDGKIDIIPDEYVTLYIITGLNKTLCPEITEARNTTQKQQAVSLAHWRGELKFLQEMLDGQPGLPDYSEKVSFYQNNDVDDEDKVLNAAYLLKTLTTCDLIAFPDESDHPVEAYNSVEKIINRVSDKQENYKAMSEIGLDILRIRDYIIVHSAYWEPSINIVFDPKKSKLDTLIFLNGESKQKAVLAKKLLVDGVAYPIVASLRQFMKVIDTPDGKKIVWRDGYNISKIFEILDDGLGSKLVRTARNSYSDNPTGSSHSSVSKNKHIYGQIYSAVSSYLLNELRA